MLFFKNTYIYKEFLHPRRIEKQMTKADFLIEYFLKITFPIYWCVSEKLLNDLLSVYFMQYFQKGILSVECFSLQPPISLRCMGKLTESDLIKMSAIYSEKFIYM